MSNLVIQIVFPLKETETKFNHDGKAAQRLRSTLIYQGVAVARVHAQSQSNY